MCRRSGKLIVDGSGEANERNRRPHARTRPDRDVAALAGVSVGTASKALNGRGQLREETRERVRAAAEQLGFRPNTVARSLLAGRTYTVGLITTDNFGRFSIPLMLGAEDALGAGEISAFMCDSRDDPIREQHYVRTLLSRRVDGHHRHRPPHRAAAAARPDLPDAGRLRLCTRRPTRPTARWSATRRRAPRRPSSTCCHRARRIAPRHRPAAASLGRACAGRALDGALRRRREPPAARAVRRVERGLGPPGRRHPARAPTPTSTRSSAAATRSPAGSPTACASAAGACPRTSRWSAWTTGRRSPRTAGRR